MHALRNSLLNREGSRVPTSHQLTGSWRKSSASEAGGCIEVRLHDQTVQLRNSRLPLGHVLEFTFDEWKAFLDGIYKEEFTSPQ